MLNMYAIKKENNNTIIKNIYNNKLINTRLSLLLTIIGIIIWIYMILTTQIWWVPQRYEFGLFQILPIWFWISFFFILLGILLPIKQR